MVGSIFSNLMFMYTFPNYLWCAKPDEEGGEKAVLTAVKVACSVGRLDATQPLKIIYVT